MDLRCDSVKHAELLEPHVIEVKCRSRFCGAAPGVVVLHRFETETGTLLATERYREPERSES